MVLVRSGDSYLRRPLLLIIVAFGMFLRSFPSLLALLGSPAHGFSAFSGIEKPHADYLYARVISFLNSANTEDAVSHRRCNLNLTCQNVPIAAVG
jgi:hypothetical protein